MAQNPAIPARSEVVAKLRAVLPEKDLAEFARDFGVTVEKQGRVNKGWAGQTVEKIAGLNAGNFAGKDGIDFELKSTRLVMGADGKWKPKETIKVTQLNPLLMLEETFETSLLWQKLGKIILVGVEYQSPTHARLVSVNFIDITKPEVIEGIRNFWNEVQQCILDGQFPKFSNMGTSNELLQLRGVSDGKQWSTCPVTGERFPARAFYATKRLIETALLPTSML